MISDEDNIWKREYRRLSLEGKTYMKPYKPGPPIICKGGPELSASSDEIVKALVDNLNRNTSDQKSNEKQAEISQANSSGQNKAL